MYWASSDDAFPLADAVSSAGYNKWIKRVIEQRISNSLESGSVVVYHPHFLLRQKMRCVSDAREHLQLIYSSKKQPRPAVGQF